MDSALTCAFWPLWPNSAATLVSLLFTSPLWLSRVPAAGLTAVQRVHPVKALSLQGADVITEQGEHQRFLRLEHLQAAEQEDACDEVRNGQDQQRQAQKHPVCIQQSDAVNEQGDGCHIAQQGEQQYRHAVFAGIQNFLFHNKSLLIRVGSVSLRYQNHITLSTFCQGLRPRTTKNTRSPGKIPQKIGCFCGFRSQRLYLDAACRRCMARCSAIWL